MSTSPPTRAPLPIQLDDATHPSVPTGLDDSSRSSPPLRHLLLATDLLMILASWLGAVAVTEGLGRYQSSLPEVLVSTAVILLVGGLLLRVTGLDRRRVSVVRRVELGRILRVVLGLVVTAGILRIPIAGEVGWVTVAVAAVCWALLLATERGLFREWIKVRRAGGDFHAPVVVAAGHRDGGQETASFLAANPFLGFEVRGIVCPDGGLVGAGRGRENGRARRVLDAPGSDTARMLGVTGVVVDSRDLTGAQLHELVQDYTSEGLHVHISSGLRGIDERRITVSPLADETFLHVAPLGLSAWALRAKRAVDLVLGSLILVLSSPVLALGSLLVRMSDRGPVLFRQQRIGLHGEPFTVYKLRTMSVGAEQRRDELQSDNGRDGPLFKMADDPRVTPVGWLLRATSIDELPQLFNVLQGTMSLVGPRPALADEVAEFDEPLRRRLRVKPGVTGLWQVEARDSPNFDLYRRFDLLYLQNWSVGLDLAILARTVAVVGIRGLQAVGSVGRRGSSLLH